jgi:hypothetical protein
MAGRIAVLFTAIAILCGCSGLKTYRGDYASNLRIVTTTDSTFLSRVHAAVDIYNVDAGCAISYQGTVELDDPTVTIGIAPDETSYLVFVFSSSAFLANSDGTISYETMLRPKAGELYDVDVSYQNNLYNVGIRERGNSGRGDGLMPPDPLESCTPAG